MYCVLAVESDIASVIKENLAKIEPYSNWQFEICEHSWQLDEMSTKKPDVLVLSRFLPGEAPDKLLQDIPTMFSESHIVLLVGDVDEKCKGYLRVAKENGLENYVTGDLPGDRPYTLIIALQKNRDNTEAISVIDDSDNLEEQENIGNMNQIKDQNIAPKKETNSPGAYGLDFPESINTGTTKRKTTPQQHNNDQQGDIQEKDKPQQPLQSPQTSQPFGQVFNESYNPRLNIPSGKIIGTVSNKGGVGKSTTAITLGIALAEVGVETLIVDIDFGGPNITDLLKIEPEHGIEALAGRGRGVEYLLNQVIVPTPKYENLYILPGPINKSVPDDGLFSENELAELLNLLTERFPVVIVDTPANFRISPWMPEVFQVLDLILAVVDQSIFSESDTARFAPEMLSMGVKPETIRVILNKFDPKLHNGKVVLKAFNSGFLNNIPKKSLPQIIATIPNDWVAHNLKGYKGEVVGIDDPRSQWHKVANEIAQLAGYKYERPQKKKKKGLKGLFRSLFRRNE